MGKKTGQGSSNYGSKVNHADLRHEDGGASCGSWGGSCRGGSCGGWGGGWGGSCRGGSCGGWGGW